MAAKRYLIVSRWFHPANSPRAHRTTELAKELSRQGHQVTVVAPYDPQQLKLAKEFGIRLVDLGSGRLPAIPTKFKGRPSFFLRAIRRTALMSLAYPEIDLVPRVLTALKNLPKHDVLISIAAPHQVHWGTARAIKANGNLADVWIADCGDPFMGQENDSFRPAFYFAYAEKAFCRVADAIVVPIEGARGAYYPEFHEKIHVIPQGFRFEDYVHLKGKHPGGKGLVRFAYAGLFIPGRRDPSALLEVLKGSRCSFEFHIFSGNPDIVKPFADLDERIIIRDFMPRMELMSELASMDFLINIENAGAKQSPSKLIDYWLCGRPILSVETSSVSEGIVSEFLNRNYVHRYVIDQPGRYNISTIAKSFDALASEVLAVRKLQGGGGAR